MKKDINKIIIETYNEKIRGREQDEYNKKIRGRKQDEMNKHAVLTSLGITNPGPHWNKETWDQEKVLADIRNSKEFKSNQSKKLSDMHLRLLKRLRDSDDPDEFR